MTGGPDAASRRVRRRIRFRWVVTSVVVGLALLLVVAWYLAPQSMSPEGPQTPLGPPTGPPGFAIGAPAPQLNGTAHQYSMQVTPYSGLTVGDMRFSVRDAHGQNVTPLGATVRLLATSGCLVAAFSIPGQAWSPGPVTAANACHPSGTEATLVTSGTSVILVTGATNLLGLGDQFVTTLPGGGTASLRLP